SKAVFEGEFLYELLGPKLVAPEESLYRVRVLVEAWAGSQGSGELSISAYGVQGDRGEVVRRLPILGLVFAVILVVLYRSLGRRGPSLTGFILGSSGLWVFYPVILALYMASVVNLDSSGPTLLQSLLGPVAVGESKGFILSVIVSTGIASVALFSYARESGLEVAEAVIGYSRPRLFAYKVASILLLSFAPVVAAMALVYLVWLPGLAASKPGIVLRVLGLEALYYLLLTIMFLGYFTLVSVLVPWTLLSLALSIIPVAALLAGAFGGSLLSPLDLVAGADPLVRGWGFLDFSVMGGLSLSETALASLALLAVSYLIYTTRSYG
ncbi:MAG: hypothetical protein LRS43_00165, partial [Desulfurococcales archaeon]|nr:hypothetical protein [Desulfurococcales archaeon]